MVQKLLKALLVVSLSMPMLVRAAAMDMNLNCEDDKGCSNKCKTFDNLVVRRCLRVLGDAEIAGNLTVGGSLTVGGVTVTAPGALLAYGYIYNLAVQTVAAGAPILFDSNGPLVGMTHVAGTGTLTVANAGTYAITYSSTSAVLLQQFAIFVNGVIAPSTVYGSILTAGITGQNHGIAILTLPAGAAVTLVNTSTLPLVLPTAVGGTETNVNASLMVIRVA